MVHRPRKGVREFGRALEHRSEVLGLRTHNRPGDQLPKRPRRADHLVLFPLDGGGRGTLMSRVGFLDAVAVQSGQGVPRPFSRQHGCRADQDLQRLGECPGLARFHRCGAAVMFEWRHAVPRLLERLVPPNLPLLRVLLAVRFRTCEQDVKIAISP